MTHPTHGLDPNALEAAESAYAAATMDLPHHECEDCAGSGVIITGRGEAAGGDTCHACGGGGVVVDFPEGWNPMASAITAYRAALSQNPRTSNTSGEHVTGGAKTEHVAALEPRASDTERTIEECAKVADAEAERLRDQAKIVPDVSPSADADRQYLRALARVASGLAAAIRKLSEVSHEH